MQEAPKEQDVSVVPLKRQTPRYEMRFVPYDEEGKIKRNCPMIGDDRGPEDGDIWGLPLEYRHETWWELVNESDVPPEELELDTKKRERFMVAAKKSEEERAKNIRPARVPIR